jgi:hypothetical protein
MGVSGVPDIRESGPTGYPGYLRDIRDIRNQDQGWGYQVPSLISLIQHRLQQIVASFGRLSRVRRCRAPLRPRVRLETESIGTRPVWSGDRWRGPSPESFSKVSNMNLKTTLVDETPSVARRSAIDDTRTVMSLPSPCQLPSAVRRSTCSVSIRAMTLSEHMKLGTRTTLYMQYS